METILKAVLATGQTGIFTIFALMFGYFMYLKPFLEDFAIMKGHMASLADVHDDQSGKLDKIIGTQDTFQEKLLDDSSLNVSKIIDEELKARENILNEFGKVKYLLEEVLKKEERASDDQKDSFKEILIELTKLQTRLEYMSPSGIGGIRK